METKSLILPGPHAYTCQKCAKDIKVYTHAQAKFVSCAECGAYYRLNAGTLQFIKKVSNSNFKYNITLGTKGVVYGDTFTVISACERVEGKALIPWREYTLFNPIKGYLYLSEYQGHWILMDQLDHTPYFDPSTHEILYKGFLYRAYDKYRPSLNHSAGEFPYDVVNTTPEILELISPPLMLSREFTQNELRWYSGRHIEAKEIGNIFKVNELPAQTGIGLIQPQSFSLHFDTILRLSLLALALFFIVQLVFEYTSQDVSSLTYNGSLSTENNNQPVSTPSFEIKGGVKNLVFHMNADVDNQWIETGVLLVNEGTSASFDFSSLVEYYHGYSDGERWSEGSRENEKIIEAVPSGKYHLVLYPQQDVNAPPTNYTIQLQRDVPRWSNLLKAIALMLIIPVIEFYRRRMFERERWADSDYRGYTPFKEETQS